MCVFVGLLNKCSTLFPCYGICGIINLYHLNHNKRKIHLSASSSPYQRPGSSGSELIKAAEAACSQAMCSKPLRGDPEAFTDQLECIIPPESSGLPPSQTCPEYLHREASGRQLNQMPPPPRQASVQHKGATVARIG